LRRRTSFAFITVIVAFLIISTVYAEKITASPKKTPSDIPEGSSLSVPDWLKRIDYGMTFETDQKPRLYFETVQPLYQSEDKLSTFFTHDRISLQDERGTYSAGLGYRRLLFNENMLAGINTFFDYQDLQRHYRQGVGLEALSKTLELRGNGYFGLSPKRLIEDTTGSKTYEKVSTGGDIELGGPIPYVPRVKMFGSYYRYNFTHSSDMKGWKARSEFKPFKLITINLETFDDNKGSREWRVETRLCLNLEDFGSKKDFFSNFRFADEPFPNVDLKKRTLDRVERNFNIQVEKWKQAANGTISIRRGN